MRFTKQDSKEGFTSVKSFFFVFLRMFAFFNHAMYANHSLSKQKDCFSRCFNGLLVSFRLVLKWVCREAHLFLCPNVKFIEISAEKCRREAVLCAEKCIFVRKLCAEKC